MLTQDFPETVEVYGLRSSETLREQRRLEKFFSRMKPGSEICLMEHRVFVGGFEVYDPVITVSDARGAAPTLLLHGSRKDQAFNVKESEFVFFYASRLREADELFFPSADAVCSIFLEMRKNMSPVCGPENCNACDEMDCEYNPKIITKEECENEKCEEYETCEKCGENTDCGAEECSCHEENL